VNSRPVPQFPAGRRLDGAESAGHDRGLHGDLFPSDAQPAAGERAFAYSIYLCAGVLTWGLFAEITSRAPERVHRERQPDQEAQFPRICLPIIVVLNACVNFAIIFGLFTRVPRRCRALSPAGLFLALLPVLPSRSLFSIGLGMVLGVLNVFFRDVGQFFNILLQFWFWFTPVVYPVTPCRPRNPLAAGLESDGGGGRRLPGHPGEGPAPDWGSLLPVTVLALLLCALGCACSASASGEMVDEL
jgi:lipopolysaccharide transport system permease protein